MRGKVINLKIYRTVGEARSSGVLIPHFSYTSPLGFMREMKKRIFQLIVFSLMVLVISSCDTRQNFDSNKWKQKGVDWWMTDFREKMVDDLIQSDTLIGLNRKEVIELLGKPMSENEKELVYLIREKYGTDIDPEYISNLQVEFDNEGHVIKCKIEK